MIIFICEEIHKYFEVSGARGLNKNLIVKMVRRNIVYKLASRRQWRGGSRARQSAKYLSQRLPLVF